MRAPSRQLPLALLAVALLTASAEALAVGRPAGQEARERQALEQLTRKADELRAQGRNSGREWRALEREIEEQSDSGSARATWWLLEARQGAEEELRGSTLRARRRLWEKLLENGEEDPWVARGHALAALVGEAHALDADWVLKRLERLERATSRPEVRAASVLHQALTRAPLDPAGREVSDRDRERARAALEGLVAEADPRWSPAAARALWRMEHLTVGQPVPGLVGRDVHGNEVRLHDGRGKVCVLHFFGFGAPDVERIVERDRGLVKRHWDDRFWLVGVNEDIHRNRFLESLEKHRVDWDVVWEGELERNRTTASLWHLEPREHTFVLDEEGILRAVDPSPGRLELLLEELIARTHERAARRLEDSGRGPGPPPGEEPPDEGDDPPGHRR